MNWAFWCVPPAVTITGASSWNGQRSATSDLGIPLAIRWQGRLRSLASSIRHLWNRRIGTKDLYINKTFSLGAASSRLILQSNSFTHDFLAQLDRFVLFFLRLHSFVDSSFAFRRSSHYVTSCPPKRRFFAPLHLSSKPPTYDAS